MKRLLLALLLFVATAVMADEITFSFVIGQPGSLVASGSGLTMGPADNVLVSDTTTNTKFNQAGTFTASAGPASSFTISTGLVIATYTAGGTNSVLIMDGSTVLVAGTMSDNASFLSSFPNGTGAFLGKFHVTAVDPAVLALFGLGPNFLDDGSVSATFANDNVNNMQVVGTLGGGTVTIETPVAVVPEPAGLGFLALGFLASVPGIRLAFQRLFRSR